MSLINTLVQNWRIKNPQLDKNMTRPQEYGALNFFIDQTEMVGGLLTPDLRQRAMNSIGTTIEIPVIDYDGNVTISNVRSCVIEDAENTSQLYTVVFATYAWGFTMTPSLYLKNDVSYEHDLFRKLEKGARAFATAMDKDAVAALEANKTQVFFDLLNYTEVGNVIDVPNTMETEILGDLNPIMRANEYPGLIHLIGNAGIDSLTRKLNQLGVYNEVNKRLEFSDKVYHYTNNVVNEDGYNGTAFAVEDGNVGILFRFDREASRRARSNIGHEWDVTRLPYTNVPFGTHYYETVGDMSTIAGASSADMTCVIKEHYGFSVDVAYVVAYNSDPETIPNPIIKFQIVKKDPNVPVAKPVQIIGQVETVTA